MKQSPFYGLIFLLLASMGQETFAMKWTKQQWANGFRLGMKTLNYAGVMGLPTYIISKIDIIKKQIKEIDKTPATVQASLNPASSSIAETEKYILNVLHTAYPELKNIPIKVINLPCKAWATCPHKGTHYFATPCTDQDLKTATSTTLSLWNVIIRHEGSHILHNDKKNGDLIAIIAPAAIIYGSNKMKATLGLTSLFSKSLVAGDIIKALGYIPSFPLKLIASIAIWRTFWEWREYQADQEAIKRTQDPNELRLVSSILLNLPTQKPANLKGKIANLLDPHPAKNTRAKYFAEAAQKLEEKQAQQSATKN